MKRIFVLSLFLIIFAAGCKPGKPVKPDSSGKVNQLLIVMKNSDWKGALGDTVRRYFASDVNVLPQREPLFSLSQLDPQVFDENFFTLRNILMLRTGDTSGVKFMRNSFAEPQLIAVVQAPGKEKLARLLARESARIIDSFKTHEKNFILSRKKKDFINDKTIREELGISIRIPTTYKLITHKDRFFWFREDLPFGSKNILLYAVPGTNMDSVARHIVEIRDSIGKKYIPGPLENTYMVTESAFSPLQHKVRFNNITAIESRGLWEMKNDYMAGPYLNYIFVHPSRKFTVVTEGFIYLPSENKRNMLLELEAILQTARLID